MLYLFSNTLLNVLMRMDFFFSVTSFVFETESEDVTQVGVQLVVLLPQPAVLWGCRQIQLVILLPQPAVLWSGRHVQPHLD